MLITDKSIVTYGFKHGSSAARDLAVALRSRNENVREVDLSSLFMYFKKEYVDNPVPIFINIRNAKQAVFSAYMQGIKEISKKNGQKYYNDPFLKIYYDKAFSEYDKHPFALFNNRLNSREEQVIVNYFLDNYLVDIYNYDEHIQGTLEYIQDAYKFLNYLQLEHPDYLQNVFIVNLDNYETHKESIGLLSSYNYMDQSLLYTESYLKHSNKAFMNTMVTFQANTKGPRGGMSLALFCYNNYAQLINDNFSKYEYTFRRLQKWAIQPQVEE